MPCKHMWNLNVSLKLRRSPGKMFLSLDSIIASSNATRIVVISLNIVSNLLSITLYLVMVAELWCYSS